MGEKEEERDAIPICTSRRDAPNTPPAFRLGQSMVQQYGRISQGARLGGLRSRSPISAGQVGELRAYPQGVSSRNSGSNHTA